MGFCVCSLVPTFHMLPSRTPATTSTREQHFNFSKDLSHLLAHNATHATLCFRFGILRCHCRTHFSRGDKPQPDFQAEGLPF